MKLRTLQRWILWLLPLMLLRAFVPAGFMVAAHSGELSLVFCSSVLAPSQPSGHSISQAVELAPADHRNHAEHHSVQSSAPSPEHQTHDGSQTESPEHSANGANSCPFALTTVTPAAEIEFFIGQPASDSYQQRFSALPATSYGPQRAESIRGPPAFI
jgi:hypothetical protein